MIKHGKSCLLLFLLAPLALAAQKPHVISFGKVISAKWLVGAGEDHPVEIKIRPLYIDARLREFTVGPAHEVTDHFFVVRRVFHINDALPGEESSEPRWRWQRGGWLLIDRASGHISPVVLPDFDSYYSAASWYRDYVAYCGVSDDGKKFYAMVSQLGRRKPILKKPIEDIEGSRSTTASSQPQDSLPNPDMPDSLCAPPSWDRQPARVTFFPKGERFTYSVRGHDAEVVTAEDDETAE